MGSQVRLPAPSHEVINQGALGAGWTAAAWDQWDIWAPKLPAVGEGKEKTNVLLYSM